MSIKKYLQGLGILLMLISTTTILLVVAFTRYDIVNWLTITGGILGVIGFITGLRLYVGN